MKTTPNLMKTLSTILLFAVLLSCSKDDNNNTDDGGGGQGNLSGFTFGNQTYTTDRGEYFDADGNAYVFFVDSNLNTVANAQFVFSKDFEMLGNGTYEFMEDRFDPNYNEDSNFWAGSIALEDGVPLNIIDGEITLNKQADGSYIISYTVSIQGGNVIGDYSGEMYAR